MLNHVGNVVHRSLGCLGPLSRPLLGWYLSGARHIDALVLSPPGAVEDMEGLARQIYHRHLAALLVARLQRVRSVVSALLVVACMAALLVRPGPQPAWVPVALIVGLVALNGWVSRQAVAYFARRYAEDDKRLARGLITRTFLRPIPADCPADLRDPWRWTSLTQDGRVWSAEITEMDGRMTVSAMAPALVNLLLAVGAVLLWTVVFGGGLVSMPTITGDAPANPLFVVPIFVLIVGMVLVGALAAGDDEKSERAGLDMLGANKTLPELRALMLDDGAATTAEAAAWLAAGGSAHAVRHEQARAAQIEHARRDTSPVVTLGTATGILAGRGDFLAPSPCLPVAMSLVDMQAHTLLTGGTGSGKTSVIRAILRQVADWVGVGVLVLDGKAALGAEMAAAIPDLVLIDPAQTVVSLVAGVTPTQLAEVVQDRLGQASQDRFWIDSAAGLLRQAAVIAHRAGRYSLAVAYRVAVNERFRASFLERLPAAGNDIELEGALDFFASEWPDLDPKTRSGIVQTLRAVYLQIAAHADLMRWAEAEEGAPGTADLSAVLRGGRVAVVAPAYRYGQAGPLVTAVLKVGLYNRIKARADKGLGDGETPVVIAADEFQGIAVKEHDSSMATIGRSLQVAMILATQTVEHLNAALGEAEAAALLQVIGSHIALAGRSRKTDEMISARIGATFRATLTGGQFPGVPSTRAALTVQAAAGSRAAAHHHPDIADAISWGMTGLGADLERRRALGALSWTYQEAARWADMEGHKAHEGASVLPMCIIGAAPLIDAAEVPELTAVFGSAVVAISRGRTPRRDVVNLTLAYR